jgi:hypothetical protein
VQRFPFGVSSEEVASHLGSVVVLHEARTAAAPLNVSIPAIPASTVPHDPHMACEIWCQQVEPMHIMRRASGEGRNTVQRNSFGSCADTYGPGGDMYQWITRWYA